MHNLTAEAPSQASRSAFLMKPGISGPRSTDVRSSRDDAASPDSKPIRGQIRFDRAFEWVAVQACDESKCRKCGFMREQHDRFARPAAVPAKLRIRDEPDDRSQLSDATTVEERELGIDTGNRPGAASAARRFESAHPSRSDDVEN